MHPIAAEFLSTIGPYLDTPSVTVDGRHEFIVDDVNAAARKAGERLQGVSVGASYDCVLVTLTIRLDSGAVVNVCGTPAEFTWSAPVKVDKRFKKPDEFAADVTAGMSYDDLAAKWGITKESAYVKVCRYRRSGRLPAADAAG